MHYINESPQIEAQMRVRVSFFGIHVLQTMTLFSTKTERFSSLNLTADFSLTYREREREKVIFSH